MSHHKVKSWTWLFEGIICGAKKHDIRDMRDRDYKVGDTMLLQEWDQRHGKYTGREALVEITFVTSREQPCAFSSAVLDRNFAVLSIALLDQRAKPHD